MSVNKCRFMKLDNDEAGFTDDIDRFFGWGGGAIDDGDCEEWGPGYDELTEENVLRAFSRFVPSVFLIVWVFEMQTLFLS
jgi:hypothetical protein